MTFPLGTKAFCDFFCQYWIVETEARFTAGQKETDDAGGVMVREIGTIANEWKLFYDQKVAQKVVDECLFTLLLTKYAN